MQVGRPSVCKHFELLLPSKWTLTYGPVGGHYQSSHKNPLHRYQISQVKLGADAKGTAARKCSQIFLHSTRGSASGDIKLKERHRCSSDINLTHANVSHSLFLTHYLLSTAILLPRSPQPSAALAMSGSRRQQLSIHDGEDDDFSTSPEVNQEAPHSPTTSSPSSPPSSPGLPPGALNQILARLGDRVNEAQQEILTFNNTLRAVGEYEAAGTHISRVSYEESGAGLLKRFSSPSVSPLSTPPSSPSLMAQPDSQPSSTVPSLMPSTYPTPAAKIDRHTEFEAEALQRRATSRESRGMSSDVTAVHKTAVTETHVNGNNDTSASLSAPHPILTPSPTTSSSPLAPETCREANGQATDSTSDMASNIQQDIKEVANGVQTEYPTDQKPGVDASEETLAKELTIADVILTAVHASHRVSSFLEPTLHTDADLSVENLCPRRCGDSH